MRQLLDFEPLWRDYPHFLVTEDTALGRSLAQRMATSFVPHFALGQARLGAPFLMGWRAIKNCVQSLAIVLRHRPQVLITTGAGSQIFVTLWARILGARIVLIDSFARFERPSAFARLAGPLAHRRYSQSVASARHWPGAMAFDPLRRLDTPPPTKEDILFASVGATLPFPRLVELVIEAKKAGLIPEQVVLQHGPGGAPSAPVDGITMVEEMEFGEVQALLRRARLMICHGGTGSILTGLRQLCLKLLVVHLSKF